MLTLFYFTQAFKEKKSRGGVGWGRIYNIYNSKFPLHMAKRISIILLLQVQFFLTWIITIHVLEKLLATPATTTAKQKGSKWLFWSMCYPGKGFLAPLFTSYHLLLWAHTLEGLYQLVSQITYALRQLNKSVKGAAEGATCRACNSK